MDFAQPELKSQEGSWIVELESNAGQVLEYRYKSEKQARFFAAIFEMKPKILPSPAALKAEGALLQRFVALSDAGKDAVREAATRGQRRNTPTPRKAKAATTAKKRVRRRAR
jgi:hypothetical protein